VAEVRFSRLVASGGGVGFVPVAPGTAGSALALVLGAGLLALGWWVLAVGCVVACAVGWWACAAEMEAGDAGWIVVDEVAGQWIALLGLAGMTPSLPGLLPWLLAAFGLFRLFDIAKPWPVCVLDRRHDAIGVMGDDVVAGAMAAAVVFALRWAWIGLIG